MGCGASSKKKKVATAREQSVLSPKRPLAIAATANVPADCSAELKLLLTTLGLDWSLPRLQDLGVRTPSDVAELLVPDLEEVGLTRVQIRQVQRAVSAATSGSAGSSDAVTQISHPTTTASAVVAVAGSALAANAVTAPKSPSASKPQALGNGGLSQDHDAVEELHVTQSPREEPQATLSPEPELLHDVTINPIAFNCIAKAASRPPLMVAPDQGHDVGILNSNSLDFKSEVDSLMLSDCSLSLRQAASGSALAENQRLQSGKAPATNTDDSRLQVGSSDSRANVEVSPPQVGVNTLTTTFDFDVTLAASDAKVASQQRVEVQAVETTKRVDSDDVIHETLLPCSPQIRHSELDDTHAQVKHELAPSICKVAQKEPHRPNSDQQAIHSSNGRKVACEDASALESGSAAKRQSPEPLQVNKELSHLLDDAPSAGGLVGQQMPDGLRNRLDKRAQERSESRRQAADRRGNEALPAPAGRPPLAVDSGSSGSSPSTKRQSGSGSNGMVCVGRGMSLEPARSGTPQQSAESRAQSEGSPCRGGRQMLDKNELRLTRREVFLEAIERYRSASAVDVGAAGQTPDLATCTLRPTTRSARVYVRKRPLTDEESTRRKEYDVATVLRGQPFPTKLMLHNCLFQADLKTPYVNHLEFEFDHVFGESAQNVEVYRRCAFDLVFNARQGGSGTIFMFGQTGSGKTHTMTAIETMAAKDLFEDASEGGEWLSIQFVELRGNRCYDLLAPGPKDRRPELKLREDASGRFFADGALLLRPRRPEELCRLMREAHSRRATSATEANSVSSRSHALCTLNLLRSKGQLTLVDCAGTERRKDSMYHSRERQQEAAEINASLHALKECIRHVSLNERVPQHTIRSSALSKLLSEAFAQDKSQLLAAICTVSACASDTEHSLSTLRTGMALGGRGAEKESREQLAVRRPEEAPAPGQWDPAQVRAWLSETGGGQFRDICDALPADFTGKMLVRLPEGRFVQLCGGNERRGRRLFELLHERIRARSRQL
eukprot:TRINITY_DN28462_c0_g2_i3.p1 TRINITY_DN28462_c0_g2~~TRINITY_DN28462_c0_g2_i3.p1  ORF type:complete len:1029 (-),score=184.15 TRINITY_DN28462_c0_g2_i3:104-3130(-)